MKEGRLDNKDRKPNKTTGDIKKISDCKPK